MEELGGKIVMKAPVREITQHDEGVVVKSDAGIFTGHYTVVAMPPCLTGRITYDPPLPRERNQVPQRSPMGAVVKILAFYGAPHWRTEGAPLSEQVTFALNPHAFNADHHLYIDSVYDVSPPGGPGVLASFLWNDDAFELLNKGEAVARETILNTWASFLCCPDIATKAIYFIVVDWPSQQWTGGAYTSFMMPGAWTSLKDAFTKPCGRIHWTGAEIASSWPGFYEGAIVTAEKVAVEVGALLKEEGAHGMSRLPSEGAWDLPRSHTLRLVTSCTADAGTVALTAPELN